MSQFPFTGGGQVATDSAGRPLAGQSGQTPVSGSFTGVGNSAAFNPISTRDFNISLGGTYSATFRLERSFDYSPVPPLNTGTWFVAIPSSLFTSLPASFNWNESEEPAWYRLVCESYTSGTANYRISQ